VFTGVASDNEGNSDTETDDATVTFDDVLPDITLAKTPDPTTIGTHGYDVTYTIEVTNHNNEDVTLDSLTDTKFGDLDGKGTCVADGSETVAGNGGTYTCSFTEFVSGEPGIHTNVATGSASDNDGNSDSADAQATVTIVPATGEIAATGTTCEDVFLNTPPSFVDLTEAYYKTKGGEINSIAPGVFFYYTKLTAPSSTFDIEVKQTYLPWVPIGIQKLGQVVLYDDMCVKSKVQHTVVVDVDGTVKISVEDSEVEEGDTFYVGIKYDPDTLARVGFTPAPDSHTYWFKTYVETQEVYTSWDYANVLPK